MTVSVLFWVVIAILAILIGALAFSFAKAKGKTKPEHWFIGGAVITFILAIAYAFSTKKK